MKVILAFDFMRLTFRDCLWAHAMNPPLTLAFPPEEEKEEEEDLERVSGGESVNPRASKRSQPTSRRPGGEEEPPVGGQIQKTKKLKSERRGEQS